MASQKCQLAAVVGAISKQMLQLWPALAERPDDLLCSSCILHISRDQIDNQQAPVRVHGHMLLAALQLLGRAILEGRAVKRALERLSAAP